MGGSWPRGNGQHGDSRAALSGDRGVHVRESIRLERPIDEVYRFWRRLENLPQFMTYLEQVTDLGNGLSHWVARGPAGLRVAWDAEIINDEPNALIAWRSLANANVDNAGSVRFVSGPAGRGTVVRVVIDYIPPAGRLGKWVANLFGTSAQPGATGGSDSLAQMTQQLMQNPEAMRAAMQMFGGIGGEGAAPAGGASTMNAFGNIFGPGDMGAGRFGELRGGATAPPADTRPPEEIYASQLGQLNDMGFYEFERNVQALRRSGGSVQGAIEFLLGGS